MEKIDLRIIKSKRALYNALIHLMKKKTFEEIKVSDICNEALINRSTFYAHFEDKYSLLSSMLDNLKQQFNVHLYTVYPQHIKPGIFLFSTHGKIWKYY